MRGVYYVGDVSMKVSEEEELEGEAKVCLSRSTDSLDDIEAFIKMDLMRTIEALKILND